MLIGKRDIYFTAIYLGKRKRGKVINKFGKVTFEIKENENMEIYERQPIEIQLRLEMASNRKCTLIPSSLKSLFSRRRRGGADQRRRKRR